MRACKQVLINRDVVRPPPSASDGFDVSLIGDADVVTAHLAAAIGLSVPAEHGGKAPAPSREPDAVCRRGAVWAVAGKEGDLEQRTEELHAEAEDEETVELVTCDGCQVSPPHPPSKVVPPGPAS